MLASYQGIVENGRIRLIGATLPEGAQVLVVAPSPATTYDKTYPPEVQEQLGRLNAIPPEEWRKSFDAIRRAWKESAPAELENEELTDQELVRLVHDFEGSLSLDGDSGFAYNHF